MAIQDVDLPDAPSRARVWLGRTARLAAGCLALVLLVLLLAHSAPVRRAVLRWAASTLDTRSGLTLRADALTYNLLALRLSLTGVRIAGRDTPDLPLFTADRVDVSLPSSVLFGRLSIDRLRGDNVRLSILRRADGTTNLPPSGAATGEPQALEIRLIEIPRLGVDIRDEPSASSIAFPALSVNVTPAAGSVRLIEPAIVRRGDVQTTVSAFGGGLTFDGRAVTLSRFAMTTPEADVLVDGALALLVREPRMDLRVAGRTNLQALARWATSEPGADGQVSVEGTLAGPWAAPAARARLHSDRIAWKHVSLSALSATLAATTDRLDVTAFEASLASGRLVATAGHVFETGVSDLATTWTGIRLDTLISLLAPAAAPPLGGVATGAASIRLAGIGPATLTVDARTRVDGAPGRRQLGVPGTATLRIAGGRWRLEADHEVGTVPTRIAAGGRLDSDFGRLMRSTIDGTIVLGDTDLPGALRALRAAGLADVGEGALSAGRAEATAEVSGTFAAPRFAIRAAARGLASGGISGIDVDLLAAGPAERLEIDVRARQGGANAVQISGELWPAARRIETSITGTLAQPGALLASAPMTGAIELRFQVGGPFTAIAGRGTLAARGLEYDRFRIGRADATVTIDPDRVSADLVAPELGARMQAGMALTGTRRASGDLRVDDADLARLLEGTRIGVEASGRISLTARADSPLDEWRDGEAELTVTALNATVGELSVGLTQPARASYRTRVLEVASLDAGVGATRLSVTGRLPLFAATSPAGGSDALSAVLSGDLTDVLRAAQAAGLADVSGLSARGPMRVTARVAGAVDRPIVTGDLEVGPSEIAVDELPPVRAFELRARLADGWFDGVTASGEWQDSLVSGEARIPLRLLEPYLPAAAIAATPPTSGPATLTARALSIRPAVLSPFLDAGTLAQIDGVVEASARIEAPSLDLDDIRGELRLDRLDVRVAGLPVAQREPTRITIGRGLAQVAGWDWSGQGAALNVQGQVRLADRDAAIRVGGQLDLRMLTPFVRDAGLTLAGTLTPRVAIVGPLAAPRLDGEITLAAGDVRLRDPRVIATELAATAILAPTGARITSVTGAVNGGALTLAGEVSFGAGAPIAVRVSGQAAGVGLEFPAGLRSELNADLALTLEDVAGTPSGALTGSVTVLRSAYREPLAVVTGLLAALRTQRLSALARPEDDLARRLALDVRVTTDADVVVDNNLARLQLGGDLRAIGTVAAPSLAGRASLREGGQLFLGPNVYTVDAGTIDFTNPDVIEPNLQVQATTRAGGHEIALTLAGTPDTLDVTLRSLTEPELGEADVASLLLTGRVLADVPGAEGRIVGQQVLGYLSGDLFGVTSRAVGLDTIRLGGVESATLYRDPTAVAAATDPTTRLTFGKSFGNKVEVTYSQSLREGDAQTWIIDYTPLPHVGLRLVSGDDTLRSYEFRHDVSLGAGGTQKSEAGRETVEPRVLEVLLTGELGLPEPTLRGTLRLEPGDRFDFSEWQRDRDRLEETLRGAGRLEARVTARRDEQPAGVVLSYAVEAGPRTTIAIGGYEVSQRVRRLLESAWRESVYDGFLTEEAEAIVRRALAEEGYLDADVSSGMTSTAADAAGPASKTLSVAIEPGARTASRRLAVDAGDEVLSRELEEWVRARGLEELAWREPQTIEASLAAELHARGYASAQVSIATRSENGRTAVTTITIAPGAAFTVRDVRFAGATHIAAPMLLDAAMPVAAGAAYAPAAVDAARERLARVYRRAGFSRAQVSAAASVDTASHAVIVTYTVTEGPRQILREISIGGAQGIDQDVIARALRLTVGEPLGSDAWLEARARLFDTALFRRADVAVEPIGAPLEKEDEQQPVRVRVTVQEWPALRLRYGLRLAEEWAPDDPDTRNVTPGLSMDVTRRTLFGRAVTLGAVAEYQRRERLARMFANAPTLFGWPIETLVSLERSREEFADATLVSSRSGVSMEQRVRLARHLRLSYTYRFDRDHTLDTNPNQDPLVPTFDVTVNIARLTGTAVVDSRNDPLDSTRGWLLSSNLEYAPASLGSEFRFVRHVSQAYYFRPWRRTVLASAARLGLASPKGGQTLIPSERFYAGGSRSVRGLPEDGLGGRDIFGNLIGGAAMVILNQELRFPIYRWVRGVGFLDAGNVYDTPSSIDLRRLTSSVGAGLRIATPFALLRADYGRVWSERGVTSGRWTFGIGQSF